MKSFDYFNPVKIHYEIPCRQVLEHITQLYSKILLVTTDGVLKRSPFIQEALKESQIEIISNIRSNPELDFLQKIKKKIKEPQCILAIGGGSVIDSAKFLSVMGDISPQEGMLHVSSNSNFIPIFAIPTTAGTSSELTKWATIWDSTNFIKYSLSHEKLYPQEAFYDSRLMLSLPREETINGALDTLSHCLESIWNKNSNPISTHYAISGIELILKTLPSLLENLQSLELRKKITLSNIYSGLAFSNTQTALAHALSYFMTMKFDIPHGIACSITLPILLDNMQDGQEKEILLPYKQKISELFEKIGISYNLSDYGFTQKFMKEVFASLNARAKNGLFEIEVIQSTILETL